VVRMFHQRARVVWQPPSRRVAVVLSRCVVPRHAGLIEAPPPPRLEAHPPSPSCLSVCAAAVRGPPFLRQACYAWLGPEQLQRAHPGSAWEAPDILSLPMSEGSFLCPAHPVHQFDWQVADLHACLKMKIVQSGVWQSSGKWLQRSRHAKVVV